MKLSTFLTIKAIVAFVFAVVQLVVPETLIALLGGTADATAVYLLRTVGACMMGVGAICWYASRAERSALRQGVLLGYFVADTLGFVVALVAQGTGLMNAAGWIIVAIWLLLAVGLGYFRFVKPETT